MIDPRSYNTEAAALITSLTSDLDFCNMKFHITLAIALCLVMFILYKYCVNNDEVSEQNKHLRDLVSIMKETKKNWQ